MTEVTLSASVRNNLLSLQRTTGLINRTQTRLATGLSISSPIDDAVKFFQAKTLLDRASDLSARKDGIDQGVSSLKTVLEATDAIESLTNQIKYVEVLQEGADKLRLADLNEEGANLLALQTRQQLGIQALAFAGQSEQSILGLFR